MALIRFPSGPQIVLGDSDGELLASLDGQPLWSSDLGSSEVRGMDDAKINGQTYAAIATNDGSIAVYDADGNRSGHIRRSNYVVCVPSILTAMATVKSSRAANMAHSYLQRRGWYTLFNKSLGQAISEVREVELNGDPSSQRDRCRRKRRRRVGIYQYRRSDVVGIPI